VAAVVVYTAVNMLATAPLDGRDLSHA